MNNRNVLEKLTKRSLLLTALYLLLWAVGPLCFGTSGSELPRFYGGLPLWFWFSCIAAPLVLVILAASLFSRR